MNAFDREQLRLSLLGFLGESSYAMPASFLWQLSRTQGRSGLTLEEVQAELQYLEDKGLVATDNKPISPENKRWRITADGRDLLAVELGK